MVPDLDCEHASRLEIVDSPFEISRLTINLPKGPDDFAGGVENRRRIAFSGQDLGPSVQQSITRFHGLRKLPGRLHSALISDMKAGIHPEYHETDMVCACGAVYHTRSTRRDIRIGICAACHPFFTGEQKFVDTAGRVEKFAKRYGSTKAVRTGKKG